MAPSRAVSRTQSTAGEAVEEVLHAFGNGWPLRPPGLHLRLETDADLAFSRALYATTRADELAQVGWPEAACQAFIEQQFTAQRAQYRQHYPNAAFLIITLADEPIGRIYIHRTRREVRLMEVTLLPAQRGGGLGTRLMQRLAEWSDALGLPASLHVEPFNPAHRMYLRLGFVVSEVRGVYHFMQRPVGTPARTGA
jgi:GNAT superfamily N-acetyltransferase